MSDDCRRCRGWQGCVGKDGYDYGDIRWCPLQVIWLLQHEDWFEAGQWPSGYDDSPGNSGVKPGATFERTKDIWADLKARLDETDTDGKLLREQVRRRQEMDAKLLMDYLEPEARRALMYVKGWPRKTEGYLDWKRRTRNRKKWYENVPISAFDSAKSS